METGNTLQHEPGLVDKPSLIVVLFFLCFSFWLVDFWRPVNIYNGETVFNDTEIFDRYSYLPAFFLNKTSFDWPTHSAAATSRDPKTHVSGYNYGSALLNLPFFVFVYLQMQIEDWPSDGFTVSFANALHWAGIFYVLVGLLVLRKFLLPYFTEPVVALTLLLTAFGTQLFYYTFSLGELPQSQLFFLFCLLLRQTQLWQHDLYVRRVWVCGLVIALASLINFFEIYTALFFLLWNVSDRASFKQKVVLLSDRRYIVALVTPVIVLWIPQLLIDHHYSGHLFYQAHPKEKYNFADARINAMLFGFRYGWITYSPLILAALTGIFFVGKKTGISKTVFIVLTLLVLVVYSSWWDRSHGNHYGARRLVPAIAWLALPLATLIDRVFREQKMTSFNAFVRLFFISFVFSCVFFTLAQTYQVLHKRIVPEKMDASTYWKTLMTFKFPEGG